MFFGTIKGKALDNLNEEIFQNRAGLVKTLLIGGVIFQGISFATEAFGMTTFLKEFIGFTGAILLAIAIAFSMEYVIRILTEFCTITWISIDDWWQDSGTGLTMLTVVFSTLMLIGIAGFSVFVSKKATSLSFLKEGLEYFEKRFTKQEITKQQDNSIAFSKQLRGISAQFESNSEPIQSKYESLSKITKDRYLARIDSVGLKVTYYQQKDGGPYTRTIRRLNEQIQHYEAKMSEDLLALENEKAKEFTPLLKQKVADEKFANDNFKAKTGKDGQELKEAKEAYLKFINTFSWVISAFAGWSVIIFIVFHIIVTISKFQMGVEPDVPLERSYLEGGVIAFINHVMGMVSHTVSVSLYEGLSFLSELSILIFVAPLRFFRSKIIPIIHNLKIKLFKPLVMEDEPTKDSLTKENETKSLNNSNGVEKDNGVEKNGATRRKSVENSTEEKRRKRRNGVENNGNSTRRNVENASGYGVGTRSTPPKREIETVEIDEKIYILDGIPHVKFKGVLRGREWANKAIKNYEGFKRRKERDSATCDENIRLLNKLLGIFDDHEVAITP